MFVFFAVRGGAALLTAISRSCCEPLVVRSVLCGTRLAQLRAWRRREFFFVSKSNPVLPQAHACTFATTVVRLGNIETGGATSNPFSVFVAAIHCPCVLLDHRFDSLLPGAPIYQTFSAIKTLLGANHAGITELKTSPCHRHRDTRRQTSSCQGDIGPVAKVVNKEHTNTKLKPKKPYLCKRVAIFLRFSNIAGEKSHP